MKDFEDMTQDEFVTFLRECGLNIRKCEPGEKPGFYRTGIEEPGDLADWALTPADFDDDFNVIGK